MRCFGAFRCAGKEIHSVLAKAESDQSTRIIERFGEECRLLSRLHHPNVVLFLGVHFKEEALFPTLIMEFLPMSLDEALEKYKSKIPLYVKNMILYDVANGLKFLHHQESQMIIHRDLTSKNVLLSESFRAKIADLGVAKIKSLLPRDSDKLTQIPGNASVMPPEAFDNEPNYDQSLDMFSYGNLILNVFNNAWPFPASQVAGQKVVSEIDRRMVHLDRMGAKHPLREFTESCLENDKTKRPTAADAVDQLSLQLRDPPPYTNTVLMIEHVEQLIREVTDREKAANAIEQEKIEQEALKMIAETKVQICEQIECSYFIHLFHHLCNWKPNDAVSKPQFICDQL